MNDSRLETLATGRDLFLLTSRLLSKEIDQPLYRALLTADPEGTPAEDRLIDEQTGAMDEPDALRTLSVEFCRLFVGPYPACPPYASIHRGEPLVGGRADHAIRDFMTRHRLQAEPPGGHTLLAYDHLGVGLALLHHLLRDWERGVSAACPEDEDRHAVRELLEDHLLPWAPSYLHDLHGAALHAPYGIVAQLTGRLLADEWSMTAIR
ncbi:TorD/DmsD family molecular chaperone [Streptosporangium sp. OZ121]|uniref:TorD/DmsD family molecular chaperone n=1 Tax=Streptosporangium sp. OZ121 TaxID=3444183 RepID=UPI003F78B265